MTFWELVSIFRDDPMALEQVLQDSRWNTYLGWFRNFPQHVNQQDRQVLDSVAPTELVKGAMQCCKLRFKMQNGFLIRSQGLLAGEDLLTASDVYNHFGGSAIEEVLEYGSFKPLDRNQEKR
jgi:hypothetical protein